MTNLPFPNSLINHYGQKEKKHQKNTVKIGKKWKVMLKINIFTVKKTKITRKYRKIAKGCKNMEENHGKLR